MGQDVIYRIGAFALASTTLSLHSNFAQAQSVDEEIINIAQITYDVGSIELSFETNAAVFTVRPPRVDPVIDFFRYSPNADSPNIVQINGSDFSPSGDLAGPFTPIEGATNTGNTIDFSDPVPLIPAENYLAGELMFVRVLDPAANLDANTIETISVTIEVAGGDVIVLQLYETGPDTGEFWAFVPTTQFETSKYDTELTTDRADEIVASYDNSVSEVVVDSASVNPSNTVFDSMTGEPVSGAEITIMGVSGSPAEVWGIDGFSAFPSTVISGQILSDESGLNYQSGEGLFSFPIVEPGEYYLEVIPPEGYRFASTFSPDFINQTTGAGYFIVDGSYGNPFNLPVSGPVQFDIPLDPDTDLVISKTADRSSADVGDFVSYTINIENRGASPAAIQLFDTLPRGFRYVEGTARQGADFIDNPDASENGTLLTFPMGMINPGQTVSLNYALEVGPGAALGDAVNEAVLRDGSGAPISNIARAAIKLREDLFRTRSTIVGRVSEQSCDGDEEWAREIVDGVGVEGVRLYMETGAYVVSDADGLFHFEGVSEGTHVVQVDEETLPKGFSPMVCEENTRYAGRATSKFVDVQGGGIWRANFYLKRTGEIEEEVEEVSFDEATDYKNYDQVWLDTQDDSVAWVYPETSRTPDRSSINLGIKHPVGSTISLTMNERPVPDMNRSTSEVNTAGTVKLSRFKGVDLRTGENRFKAVITDKNGQVIKTLSESVWFAKTIARAEGLPDQSNLVADGRTVPTIAVRLEDEAGRAVHAGRIVTVDVEAPYYLYDETGERELTKQSIDLIAPLSARQEIRVGNNGVVEIELEPTLRTGKVTAVITLDNGRKVPIHMYLEPEKRDWIIVGLAEGSIGYETIKDKSIALAPDDDNDTIRDGRIAFFAKGLIKGNWLMTLAVDTDKRRGNQDGDFINEIDPNAYYTLYGDRSYQEYEALSRYPVFVKLEKKTAAAMFGDFDTNITEGRLTSYSRRLSGLRAEYLGENFQVMGFAAETNQGFAKDEIPADGTSGTYQLSNGNILAQSEHIVVETRDRNRPDIVLERKEMIRYLDYTLDYLTGELIFRLPVDVSDQSFNPNVIVVDYETSEEAERNVTFGGRVQADLVDGKVRVGSTFVQQNGSALSAGSKENMVGVDMVADITENTEFRAEYAVTDNLSDDMAGTSEAVLAEVIHTSEKLNAQAYFREEEAGYGLGQQNSNTNGVRRYGATARYRIDEFEDKNNGRRGQRSIEATAYHEDNLTSGNSRDTAEVLVHHQGSRLDVSGGLKASKDKLVGAEDRDSLLAVGQVSVKVPKYQATLLAKVEQPLGGKDAVTNYPQRITLGLDKAIGSKSTISVRHEILDGQNAAGQNTVVGVAMSPWKGSNLTASTDLATQESGRRLGATVGLDQQIRFDENWSGSLGVRNRQVLDDVGEYVDVAGDAAISPLEVNEDFNSAYVGMAYNNDKMTVSARAEVRDSSDSQSWIGSVGAARELSDKLSLAAAVRTHETSPKNEPGSSKSVEARIGTAWRPRDSEDLIVFNRFDLSQQSDTLSGKRTKLVNNVAVNTMLADNWQISGNYGIKHVRQDIAGLSLKSTNHLLGGETRFDITRKIDVGLRGSVMTNGNETQYSFGPSIGFSPVDNVWISAGYNVEGFEDDDFEAAEYSREGVYIQMRLKFDQDTARGLLRRISPRSVVGPATASPTAYSGAGN